MCRTFYREDCIVKHLIMKRCWTSLQNGRFSSVNLNALRGELHRFVWRMRRKRRNLVYRTIFNTTMWVILYALPISTDIITKTKNKCKISFTKWSFDCILQEFYFNWLRRIQRCFLLILFKLWKKGFFSSKESERMMKMESLSCRDLLSSSSRIICI